MRHGRQRSRNLSLDGTILDGNNTEIQDELKEKDALGKKFESDKAALEKHMDEIEASDLSPAAKRQQLCILREQVIKLKEEYEQQVTQEAEELKEDAEEGIKKMEEAAQRLKEQEAALRGIKLEAGSMDGTEAADAAAAEREKFEKLRESAVQEMELKMQQLADQRRNMLTARLRGR